MVFWCRDSAVFWCRDSTVFWCRDSGLKRSRSDPTLRSASKREEEAESKVLCAEVFYCGDFDVGQVLGRVLLTAAFRRRCGNMARCRPSRRLLQSERSEVRLRGSYL